MNKRQHKKALKKQSDMIQRVIHNLNLNMFMNNHPELFNNDDDDSDD